MGGLTGGDFYEGNKSKFLTQGALPISLELTETVTSYISFCEDMCIPTRTHLTYNNDKPWFTAKLRKLRQAKEDAYRKGDKFLDKQAKYTLEKEIRVAKSNYSDKLRNKFSSSDSASVWKGMKDITSYNTPSPSTVETQLMADNLNEFYCRFEKTPFTPPATPLSPTPILQIKEVDVCQVFKKNKRKKAPVPDGVSPACLKTCADQLAPIFTQIFNRITGAVRSSLLLQTLHHHPRPKETQNYWT